MVYWIGKIVRGHISEQFFRSNRPGHPHPVSSELENSGIRVAVGDCSVTDRRRWRPAYQTGKTVHVLTKHYRHNVDGHTAPDVCGNGSIQLSHSGSVVTRIGIHTHCSQCILVLRCMGSLLSFSVLFSKGDNFRDFVCLPGGQSSQSGVYS